MRTLWRFLGCILLAAVCSTARLSMTADQEGSVQGPNGPIAGARVRWKGTAIGTVSDAQGRFRLPGTGKRITAWKEGFYIGGAAPQKGLVLDLRPLPAGDCEEYAWVDPRPRVEDRHSCANCHAEIYREWVHSAHARAARGRRFLDLYQGTGKHGSRGGSLLAERPEGASVCVACHAPSVAPGDPAFDHVHLARGVPSLGVHCDYCHKIADTSLTRLGREHGRYAHRLLRPTTGQVFFGPRDDVDRGEETYAPLYRESRYCAACHEGTLFGVPVYTTYSEYLSSPAFREGKQCQTCHMASSGRMSNVAPGHGGVERDPRTIGSHAFLGAHPDMLRRSLHLRARLVRQNNDELLVDLALSARDIGHRLPTGFIDRHVILLVRVMSAQGEIEPKEGARLPEVVGRGTGPGAWANKPGLFLGRIWTDEHGCAPVPFWLAERELCDSRLEPGETRPARWLYDAAQAQRVEIRLVYRRFFYETAQLKGWDDNEIVLLDKHLVVPAQGAYVWSWPN